MAKLYARKRIENYKNLKPKKETISFLLQYSKALKIVNTKPFQVEIISN